MIALELAISSLRNGCESKRKNGTFAKISIFDKLVSAVGRRHFVPEKGCSILRNLV